MINENQLELLNQYKDKAFVCSLLCEQTTNYYEFIKNIINIPLILCNSVMVIINSTILDENTLKILNIILNTSTGIILGMINAYKIYEKINEFHSSFIKYNKLVHSIDSKITNNYEEITGEYINQVINDYDSITNNITYCFPSRIKKRVRKQYLETKSLPLSLSIDMSGTCCGGSKA